MPPILVPVGYSDDTSIPTGPQIDATYVLVGPDGTRAVFNDQTDRDYVGMLKEVTGLDSAEVRESAEDLVQQDGGVHGDFFYGRRPMTFTGIILNPATVDQRNRRMTKLMRASNAMRVDATLSWTLDGGYQQFVRVRRQQPLRITGAWQKEFQLAVVASDPRIYGLEMFSETVGADAVVSAAGRDYPHDFPVVYGGGAISGQLILENRGNTSTPPVLTVYGPGTNPTITNATTGEAIVLTYELADDEFLTIDTLHRTVTLNNTASRYSAVDFLNTEWWHMAPGLNDIRLGFATSSAGASLNVQWRDAWL
jgi:hypothetical protein